MFIDNTVFFKKQNQIFIQFPHEIVTNKNNKEIATILKNLSSLGYTLDKIIINALKTMDKYEVITLGEQIINLVKEALGAHIIYEPMYPNFPKQVMEASDADIIFSLDQGITPYDINNICANFLK